MRTAALYFGFLFSCGLFGKALAAKDTPIADQTNTLYEEIQRLKAPEDCLTAAVKSLMGISGEPFQDACLSGRQKGVLLLAFSKEGSRPAITALLARHRDPDPDFKNEYGETALTIAVMHSHLDAMSLLLFDGMLPNNKLIPVIPRRGANPNVQNNDGRAALHIAAGDRSFTEAVPILLHYGADAGLTDKSGETALHKAASAGSVTAVKILLESGANPNVQNNDGRAALHIAAGDRSFTEAVPILLHYGADAGLTDKSGETALHKAASAGSVTAVKILLESGANPNVQNNDGRAALHIAASCMPSVIPPLLYYGADVHLTDKLGETALHKAMKSGHVEAVKILLESGASPRAINHERKTAARLAMEFSMASTDLPIKSYFNVVCQ